MVKFIISLIGFYLLALSCSNNKGNSAVKIIPRDSTITPQNAYTNLRLDSNTIESYISHNVPDAGNAISIKNFYNGRNYQFAWFDEYGLTEQGEAFWNLHEANASEASDSSRSSRDLHAYMKKIVEEDTLSLTETQLQNVELNLTLHFFRYLQNSFGGKIDPEEMQWYIPRRKINDLAMLDSFLSGRQRNWKPLNKSYYDLDKAIENYVAIAKQGGWPTLIWKIKKPSVGLKDESISSLKKRLAITGDYVASDTSSIYTDSLKTAIKSIQRSFGFSETGWVNTDLINQLNTSIKDRLKQMKINLERMRWMPEAEPDRLLANIPEYKLHVFEKGKEVLTINIVVGKAATNTVIFSDILKYIVFSPYWNVPESIVRNEILPAMRRSQNYLGRNNMEIYGRSNGFPLIRQKPGAANSLGKVKFIFPNRFNIYFHDTPAKALFSRQQRAFSHGCMRLQQPFELAKYILRNDTSWTDSKITSAMNQTTEKQVFLKTPLPVYVVYFTSWVDADGMLNFRDDVYGHDKRMEEHLFE